MAAPVLPFPADLEIRNVLRERAAKKADPIPAGLLIDQVIRVTEGSDTRVRIAAMDALLRRLRQVRQDQLRIASGPRGREVLGEYRTRRPGRGGARPYTTTLFGLDPLDGDCDCPDFLRNSLGLCKHLLVVLEHVYAKPGRRDRAANTATVQPRLSWDPVRPLVGPDDWMARIRVAGSPSKRAGARWAKLLEHFERRDGELWLAPPPDLRARAAVIESLLKAGRSSRGVAVDPSLVARLEHERDRVTQLLDNLSCTSRLDHLLEGFGRRLYAYQREGLERALAAGRMVLADDMGLGKTTQACAWAHVLHRARKARRGLIVVPASLRFQWKREWKACTDVPVEVVEGAPEERHARYRDRKAGFQIINYELVLRDLDVLDELELDLVVLDEAQRIKNYATQTARAIKSLAPRYRLVLTGTPMQNRLEELASVLDWVDEDALAPKWRLSAWHLDRVGDGSPSGTQGARHLNTLRERMGRCLLRRVRSEVLEQLPPRRDLEVPVPLTPSQLDRHGTFQRPIAWLARIANRRPLTPEEHLKLMQLLLAQRVVCNGLALTDFADLWPDLRGIGHPDRHLSALDSPKLTAFRELLTSLVVEQKRKVIVFSEWRRMLRLAHWAVHDVLHEAGLRAVFFTGAESQPLRTGGVVELHDDPDTRVMFLTDAGGVGLNLQRAASACINLELPWNPAVLEQRVSRIYRLGQNDPVEVYRLVATEGIESRIAELVERKRQLFTGLFDGDSDTIDFDQAPSLVKQLGLTEPTSTNRGASSPGPEEEEDPDPVEADGEAISAGEDDMVKDPSSPSPPVRELLQGIGVKRREDGSMVIEACPEAASVLADVLEGMAKMLRTAR